MNQTLIALLIAVAPAVLLAQLPEYVPTQNLVGWYPFDDGANDLSGNGYDGTTYGASVIESPINGALFFDGENDYVEIPTNAEFENMVDELTLSAWFYKTNEQNGSIMGKRNFVGNPCGERHHFELLCHSDRSIKFSAQHNCVELHTSQVISETEIFELDEWNHIVVTYDNGLVKFYLNGELVLTHNEGYRELLPNNHWINFGRIHRSGGQAFFNEFSGVIDESGIWSRALTEQEAQSLFQRQTVDDSDAETNQEDPIEEVVSGCELFSIQGLAEQNLMLMDSILALNALLNQMEGGAQGWSCGDDLAYQGYSYTTVQIGEQCWFAENLQAENYLSGSQIPHIETTSEWVGMSTGGRRVYGLGDAQCGAEGDTIGYCNEPLASVVSDLGYLYNWHVVSQNEGVCPANWHVPNDSDFETLLASANQIEGDAFSSLKSQTGWADGKEGTNTSGFNALGSGYGGNQGNFGSDGYFTGFWSVDEAGPSANASHLQIDERPQSPLSGSVFLNDNHKRYALSIRCIKDQ